MPDTDPQKTVFISYRRDVSSFIARAVFMDLHAHGYDVFMDVESIDSGTFDTIILNQVAARAHFLIICTPGTFDRCGEPGDWLRREIEAAIDGQRNIVPIMVNGFKFEDDKRFLTEGLEGLPRLNALPLFHEYFEAGMERLRDRFLKQPTHGVLLPVPKAELLVVSQKIKEVAAQPPPTLQELTHESYFFSALERSDDDLEGQIADYSEAIRLDPSDASAYNNRGYARAEQGDLEGAIADFSETIRLDPNSVTAFCNRADAYMEQGDFAAASADYTEAIHLEPKNPANYSS